MAFQTPITIKEALENIRDNKYALPAIQRELVWRTGQIERLFDSLMLGYPIGSFLFWRVNPESVKEYKFYKFVQGYHQRDARHCPPLEDPDPSQGLIGVLDGQQRLTALNIGLRGSHATKLPRLWRDNPNAFPRKRLFLNLLANMDDNERGMQYEFRFLTEREAKHRDDNHFWYRVGDIREITDPHDTIDLVYELELPHHREPTKMLHRLHRVVHEVQTISYYEEKDQDLDKVLNIFIRTNSGGTVLSYSDLLMSIATAQWDKLDAREEIYEEVDQINQIGGKFNFSRDFLLKAGLMLADISDVRFKVTNFNSQNMAKLQEEWERITVSVQTAVELVASFGFSGTTLSANNALLPIAYYIHQRKASHNFVHGQAFSDDRRKMKRWLIQSLLKRGIWGSGLDQLLIALRSTIREHGAQSFPAEEIEKTMLGRGKGLLFAEEELQDLVDTTGRTFATLALLYPTLNLGTNIWHVDHVFPKSRFTRPRLRREGIEEADIDTYLDRVNRLPNLQLLPGLANEEKNAALPADWMDSRFGKDSPERRQYATDHDLGDVPRKITYFNAFYEARRERMLAKLRSLLGVPRSEDTASHGE